MLKHCCSVSKESSQCWHTQELSINTIHKPISSPLISPLLLRSFSMLHANFMNNWFHSNKGNVFLMQGIMPDLDNPLHVLGRRQKAFRKTSNKDFKDLLFSLTRQRRPNTIHQCLVHSLYIQQFWSVWKDCTHKSLVFSDEFLAQGLYLKSHQRCSAGIRTCLSAD